MFIFQIILLFLYIVQRTQKICRRETIPTWEHGEHMNPKHIRTSAQNFPSPLKLAPLLASTGALLSHTQTYVNVYDRLY
jgi:hypothetical protein